MEKESSDRELADFLNSTDAKTWHEGFCIACTIGNKPIVQALILQGANYWNDGLCSACDGGQIDIAQLMISNGANDYNAGLYRACAAGSMSIVQFMISKGANDWIHALYVACRSGWLSIVELIISKRENQWTIDELNSAFTCAWYNDYSCVRVIVFLISKGATKIQEHVEWPEDSDFIYELLYLKVPLETFFGAYGYEDLQARVFDTRQAIVKSNVMLSDLLSIVSKYIVL